MASVQVPCAALDSKVVIRSKSSSWESPTVKLLVLLSLLLLQILAVVSYRADPKLLSAKDDKGQCIVLQSIKSQVHASKLQKDRSLVARQH